MRRFALIRGACLLLLLSVMAFAQTAPAWQPNVAYTVGALVSYNTVTYKCLQSHTSQVGWEPPNVPALWQLVSGTPPPADTQAPTVPTGLLVTGTTSSSVSLSWTASSDNVGVTAYDVFNGTAAAGSSASTSIVISGLQPSTSYSFSVLARDAAGNKSAHSASANATTAAAPAGGGAGTCSAAAWSSTAVYTAGNQAVFNNYLWQNKWWTQGDVPTPSDSGVWVIVGYCGAKPGPAAARRFASYVDVTMGFPLATNSAQTGGFYTLAFIVDSGGCTASWAGTTPLSSNLYVSDIAALRAKGGDVIVSFGGAAGSELALDCTSAAALQAQYQTVINQYKLKRIDFDIEGGAISNTASIALRNQVIVSLQAANPGLQVSFTLPVLPTGLLANAVALLQDAIAKGVNIATVNVMAMDFGSALDNNGQMGLDALYSGWSTMAQLEKLLPAKTHAQIAAITGVTVMIGMNDNTSEVFHLTDIQPWVSNALSNGIGFLSFWSATRDKACTGPTTPAQGDCSSVAQNPLAYSAGFKSFNP
jgi:chitodextrinase